MFVSPATIHIAEQRRHEFLAESAHERRLTRAQQATRSTDRDARISAVPSLVAALAAVQALVASLLVNR